MSLEAFEVAARPGSMTVAAVELSVTHGVISCQVPPVRKLVWQKVLFFLPPCFECLNRTLVFQSALRYAVVVGVEVELEGLAQVCRRGKPCVRHQVTDAAVETLDHAIRSRMTWRAKAMLNDQFLADKIEKVLARSLFASAGRAVGELAGVVGQKRLDHHRCDALEASQEVCAADLGLVAVSAKVNPSRGPVYDHEQIPAVRLVSHLGQILDVHMDEAGLVVLECLGMLDLIVEDWWLKTGRRGHAAAHQATIQTGTRDIRVAELAYQHQQVIQRQAQHAPQLDHQQFPRLSD